MMIDLVSSGADLAAGASFVSGFVETRVWTTKHTSLCARPITVKERADEVVLKRMFFCRF